MKPTLIILGIAFLTSVASSYAAPPANDNFANAQVLPSTTSFTVNGNNDDATLEPGDPDFIIGLQETDSVWYVWTAPQSGNVALSASAAGSAKRAAVLVGPNQLSGKYIRSGEVTRGGFRFYAVSGQTYRICIYQQGFTEGPFSLGLGYVGSIPADSQFVPPLSNDNFSTPTALNPIGQRAVFYTRDATFEPFENDMLTAINATNYTQGPGGVWASWRAPINGKATVTALTSASEDVVVVAGTGDSLNTYRQNLIAAKLNGITFNCTAGVTYQFYFLCEDDNQLLVSVSLTAGGSGGGTATLFTSQSGSYFSLVGTNGFLALTLAKTGVFTGKLIFNGVTYTLVGKLDANGDFNGTAGRSTLPFSLNLDLASSTTIPGQISISGSAGGQAFVARHTVYNPALPLSESGRYTTLLQPTQAGASIPAGTGYGVLAVGRTGKAAFTAVLPDGTVSKTAGYLVGDGGNGAQLIVFNNSIYSRIGRLSSAISFAQSSASDCVATLDWVKPARPRDKYYAGGFDTDLSLEGARYTAPVRAIALNLPPTTDNAAFTATDGSLPAPLAERMTLFVNNKVAVSGANAQKLKIAVSPSTGLFAGTFIHPVSAKAVAFRGALFQNALNPRAGGYFLGPVTSNIGFSGKVTITP